MWCFEKDQVDDKMDSKTDSQKRIIAIFWPVDGFRMTELLSDADHFGNQYIWNVSVSRTDESVQSFRIHGKYLPRLIPMDKARPQTTRAPAQKLDSCGSEQMPHPSYSSDLALCLPFVRRESKSPG
jgi:hypothetical protein